MKKLTKLALLSGISVLMAGSALYFAACGDKTSAEVNDVIAAIEELPAVEELSLTDRRAVQNARSDYNALKNAEKEKVTNLDKLAALEEQVKTLLAIDGLTLSFVSDSAMLVTETYTPEITGYAYNQIETTVVYEIKDSGETGAVLNDGTITVTDCGTFTLGATVSYKNCNIVKTFEGDVEVGVAVTGTVSFAEGLNADDDYSDVTVTIGNYVVPVNADGTFTSVAQYGKQNIIVESSYYVAKTEEVTVSEGKTELGNFELALYKMENTTGSGFLEYDWEKQGYKTQTRGQFNATFNALKVPAGENFVFSIEVLETTAETGQRFGATFLGSEENNGIGLLFFTHATNGRFQYFNPVTSYTDAQDAGTNFNVPIPAGPMKLTYARIKDNDSFRWFAKIEVGGKTYMSEVTHPNGKAALAKLDAQEIVIGVGGPDLHDGHTVTWTNPTLLVGDAVDELLTYEAEVELVKDSTDEDSTAVLSKNSFKYGDDVTLTITPKAQDDTAAYMITEATLNGVDILNSLVNDQNGKYTYKIDFKTNYPDNKLSFYIKIEKSEAYAAPVIEGPDKIAYTSENKDQTIKFNITGLGTIKVEVEVSDKTVDYITWDGQKNCLNIAADLPKGTYTVTLTADNGSAEGVSTHTLEIYVEEPYTDSELKDNELGVFDSEEYLKNAANDSSWNKDFNVTTELVEDEKANDGKALKVTSSNGANNYVIVYFARQDILRSQVKSVSVRLRGENLNTTGNAIWIRSGENPQQTFPVSTFTSGEYVTITISNLAVLNAMATDGRMTKMFIHFAGPDKTPAIYIDEITFSGEFYTDETLKGENTLMTFDNESVKNVVNEGHWNSNIFPVNSEFYNDGDKGTVLKVSQTVNDHGFVQIYFAQSGVRREDVASVQITLRGENLTGVNIRTTEANNVKYTEANNSADYITITVTNSATLDDMAVNGVMTALGIHFTGKDAVLYISNISYTSVEAAAE